MLLRVDVFHGEVHVSHRDAELIALSELRVGRQSGEHRQSEAGKELHSAEVLHGTACAERGLSDDQAARRARWALTALANPSIAYPPSSTDIRRPSACS